jgi:hypothetical protein
MMCPICERERNVPEAAGAGLIYSSGGRLFGHHEKTKMLEVGGAIPEAS